MSMISIRHLAREGEALDAEQRDRRRALGVEVGGRISRMRGLRGSGRRRRSSPAPGRACSPLRAQCDLEVVERAFRVAPRVVGVRTLPSRSQSTWPGAQDRCGVLIEGLAERPYR